MGEPIRVFFITSEKEESRLVVNTLREVCKKAGCRFSFRIVAALSQELLQEVISSEIARSDLVVVDISIPSPGIFYEIGLAHAMEKPTVLLVEQGEAELPSELNGYEYFKYTGTQEGLDKFEQTFDVLLKNVMRFPRKFQPSLQSPAELEERPYVIDLEKLDQNTFENLCFELIAQMGFRRIEWVQEDGEIDVIATMPKRDPDGYEYRELWLISMGRNATVEKMLEMAIADPEDFIDRVVSSSSGLEDFYIKYNIPFDVPITILLILHKEEQPEFDRHEFIVNLERRIRKRRFPFNTRIRWWDYPYLTGLIQQYPQLGYKYFSEEAGARSGYHEKPEGLYKESTETIEDLTAIENELKVKEEEQSAEEINSAWKEAAFGAAYNLRDPIDAIEAYLESLRERVQNEQNKESLDKGDDIEGLIEEAKEVIAQFKSITKKKGIDARAVDLLPLIQQASKVAEGDGVVIDIQTIKNCPQVIADPDKITECFNELIANALHRLDKPDKEIKIDVKKALKKELPGALDKTQEYLTVRFSDNGCGIPVEDKQKIFTPFYTTHPYGTGLGLTLVKWIVDGHRGYIRETGKPGEGASFEIYIPSVPAKRKA